MRVSRGGIMSGRRRSNAVSDQGPFLSVSGSPLFQTGKFDKALNPNGGYLYTGEAVGGGLTSFTIETWINYTGASNVTAVAFEATGALATNRVTMGVTNGKGWFFLGTLNYNYDTLALAPGWHHLCVMLNAGRLRWYVDGVQRSTVNGAGIQLNWTQFRIGQSVTAAQPFVGLIDEFRLSLGQRYAFDGTAFTPPTAKFAIDPNTVMLYHLDAPPE